MFFNLKFKDILSSKINKDLLWNYISLLFLGISGLGLNVIIGRYYNSTILGAFNQVLVTYLLASILASGGINFSVLKSISQNILDKREVSSIIKGALFGTFFLSILITSLYLVFISFLSELFDSNYVKNGMYSISPAIIFFAFNKVFLQGVINGLERMRAYAVYQIIRYLLIFVFLVYCLFLSVEGDSLPVIFVYSESILFLILFIDISLKYKWWISKNWFKWSKIHIIFGYRALFSSIFIELNTRLDVIMLGIFLSDEKVGIYSFAALFAEGFLQFIVVIQNILNPKIANLSINEDSSEMIKFMKVVKHNSYKFIFLIGLITVICYPFLLSFVNNDNIYNLSVPPFITLIFGIVLASGYLPFQNILIMCNKPGMQSLMIFLICLINIFFNYLLIPIWGINGASIATFVSTVSSVFILKYFVKKQLNFRI